MKTLPLPEIISAPMRPERRHGEPLAQAFVTRILSTGHSCPLLNPGHTARERFTLSSAKSSWRRGDCGIRPRCSDGRCSQMPPSMFEPIELDDTVTDELLESADTVPAQ